MPHPERDDLSETIHDSRRRCLNAAMDEDGWDAVLLYGNAWRCDYVRYATGYALAEGEVFAIVGADGEVRLIVESPAEAERAGAECPAIAVEWNVDAGALTVERLADLGAKRVGSAPAALLPWRFARPDSGCTLGDATAMMDRLLMAKTEAELDAIRRAAALADRGYEVFMEASRPGRPEYEVIADTEAFFRSQGCPDNFMIMGSGGREVRGMHPAGERRLRLGDLVTTELTPCVDGYYAQICRTLVIGEPSAAQIKAFAVYIEATEAGCAALRAGVTAAEVARAENDVFRRHGLGQYTTSEYTRVRGHGVGLFADSSPAILEDVDVVLEAGAAVTVHPNTYHPDAGYMVLGDTAIVTADGHERLCVTPRELLSVPG